MKFLADLFAGHISLWRTFWLAGLPLLGMWDLSAGCLFTSCTIPIPGGRSSSDLFIASLVTVTSAGILAISVAIWRSAASYEGHAWWKTLFALGAKAYAILTGFGALIILSAVLSGLLHYAATGHF